MDSKYEPLATMEGQPVPEPSKPRVDARIYPGERRTILPTAAGPGPNQVLVKTAGNALQAVSRDALARDDLMAVHVPYNTQPGDEIWIQTPKGGLMGATVPPGCFAGHTFLVKIPRDEKEQHVVMGVPVELNNNSTGGTIASMPVAKPVGEDLMMVQQDEKSNQKEEPQQVHVATAPAVEAQLV